MSKSDTEMKDSERTVIAKPVASRPSSSNFRSFSELLAGAIDPPPPSTSADAAIAAIRPKTVRFKPTANRSPPSAPPVTSQIETSRSLSGNSRDNVLKPDSSSSSKPTVIYKPQAKLVSRSTVSLLANMGNFEAVPHQRTTSAAEPRAVHQPTAEKHHQFSSPILRQTSEPPKLLPAPQPTEEEPKTLPCVANVDRPSYDGYNWRKYGQKQVKGSEYPRSYYKCTHPNCPVKKKVERSFDGQIAEIVYKGEHNHAKPQPPKKASAAQEPVNPLFESRVDEGRVEGSSHQGASLQVYEPVGGTGLNTAGVDPENSCGVSGDCEDGSKGLEMEDDHEPRNKRRKGESNALIEAGTSREGPSEARVMVQNATEPETAGDGFRWRKYGQKVVKGNPYPRSYYRCTSLKCNVRKHVERVSDDPNAFVTTYEGRHNHEMPVRNPNAAGPPEPEQPQAATSKDN